MGWTGPSQIPIHPAAPIRRTGKTVKGFLEVETSLAGAHYHGFASAKYLIPAPAAFWPLINGSKSIVIQGARKREIDDQIFKYVGVGGVDKARIVQVGVGAGNLCK
jgi:hypothetical protein